MPRSIDASKGDFNINTKLERHIMQLQDDKRSLKSQQNRFGWVMVLMNMNIDCLEGVLPLHQMIDVKKLTG